MPSHKIYTWILALTMMIFIGCTDDNMPSADLISGDVVYDPKLFDIEIPESFPEIPIPEDNPMTVAGVNLGRHLFHDKILSVDQSISCSSCHLKSNVLSDPKRVSLGVNNLSGTRQAMSVVNSGYFQSGLFWDGRASSLEELSLEPVENPVEMAHMWSNVEFDLRNHELYPSLFVEAFGIERKSEITKELAAKALSQYMRALVSSADSKFDKDARQESLYNDQELLGFLMFFDIGQFTKDAECAHCHLGSLFTTGEYRNNGLDPADLNFDFPDPGLGAITGNMRDNGKFRIPSLRNIEFTAPYMHDGRFSTLEEVVDHYNTGGHFSPNRDPLMRPLGLDDYEKEALVAFLRTLSDTSFLSRGLFQNPFE